MMDAKESYRRFAAEDESVPLFLRPWWLDATCSRDGWGVSVALRGSELHAALPYLAKRRFGFRLLGQPLLTPFLGPWIRDTGAKSANDLGRQKDLMNELIDGLPPHDLYRQNWSPDVTNWLPFYWRGFSQTTRYTYVLRAVKGREGLWAGLRANIRTDIRKASERNGITVDENAPVEELFALTALTFERQQRSTSFTLDYLRRIDDACSQRGCRQILVARDSEGRPHAGAYVVWNGRTAYYLVGGGDPQLRSSGATSLCMLEAIRSAAARGLDFDFEGSMLEPVERFFRAFGAGQTPYFCVTKTPSPLLRIKNSVSTLMGRSA